MIIFPLRWLMFKFNFESPVCHTKSIDVDTRGTIGIVTSSNLLFRVSAGIYRLLYPHGHGVVFQTMTAPVIMSERHLHFIHTIWSRWWSKLAQHRPLPRQWLRVRPINRFNIQNMRTTGRKNSVARKKAKQCHCRTSYQWKIFIEWEKGIKVKG